MEFFVLRFDPAMAAAPYKQRFRVTCAEPPSILDALRQVRCVLDPTLAYRESCGLGKCGSCSVMMDGQPVLACRTPLRPGALLEPLANHPVLRDLLVDRSSHQQALNRHGAHFVRAEYDCPHKIAPCPPGLEDLSHCIGCLSCEAVCPAFQRSSARFPGPALLTQLALLEQHPLHQGNPEHAAFEAGIHNCTACMRCEHACPKGVEPFHNGVMRLRSSIWRHALPVPFRQASLRRTLLKLPTDSAQPPMVDTVLYLGCMLANRFPLEGEQIQSLLCEMGVDYDIPHGLVCCGGPLAWVGDMEGARQAMDHNLKVLVATGARRVITPCSGCGLTLRDDYARRYRELTGLPLPFQVEDMAALLSQAPSPISRRAGPLVRVAYHSPCHHGAGLSKEAEALSLLQSLPGVELVDSGCTTRCCGGMTATGSPDTALDMSSQIVEAAQRAGAQVLTTNCTFCRENLQRAAHYLNSPVRIHHLMLQQQVGRVDLSP